MKHYETLWNTIRHVTDKSICEYTIVHLHIKLAGRAIKHQEIGCALQALHWTLDSGTLVANKYMVDVQSSYVKRSSTSTTISSTRGLFGISRISQQWGDLIREEELPKVLDGSEAEGVPAEDVSNTKDNQDGFDFFKTISNNYTKQFQDSWIIKVYVYCIQTYMYIYMYIFWAIIITIPGKVYQWLHRKILCASNTKQIIIKYIYIYYTYAYLHILALKYNKIWMIYNISQLNFQRQSLISPGVHISRHSTIILGFTAVANSI